MAKGTITGSGSKVNLVISWSSTKGNGGSTVTATLYAQNNSGYYFNATVNQGYSITINGNKKSRSTAKLSSSANGKATLISHSVWVPYTGSKSITISGAANLSNIYAPSSLGTRSASGTAALDNVGTVPTKPTFTAPATSTVSETGGTITIRWNKSTSYNGSGNYDLQVRKNGGGWTSISRTIGIGTTSYNYTYPAGQGATYEFAIQCVNNLGASGFSYSNKVTTNKINPPTIGTLNTYNPYVTSALTVPLSGGSQSNGGSVYRYAMLYYGDTALKSCSTPAVNNTSASIAYAAADYAAKLGSTTYSGTFKIVAWCQNSNGTKSSTVSKTFTVNLNSDGGATPTLSTPTFSGGILGNATTCFVSGVTNLVVTSPSATLRRAPSGTTITYKISVTGVSAKSGQTATFSGLTAGTKTVTVTATDSRGLSVSVTKQCVVQSYAAPSIKNLTVERLESPNTSAKISYTLTYSPIYQYTSPTVKGTQLNGISVQQYSLNNSSYTSCMNGKIITSLNADLSYNISIRIADKVKSTTYTTVTSVIPTIKTAWSVRDTGIGIGCVPQAKYALDVGGHTRIQGDLFFDVNGRERHPIKLVPSPTSAFGDALIIGAQGMTIIGSGESADTFYGNAGIDPATETLYLTSDNAVVIASNLNSSYADMKLFTFDNDGSFHANGYLKTSLNGVTTTIGSNNSGYCHYSTTATRHWFNKQLCVQGDVYGGSDYNRRLAYLDEVSPKGCVSGKAAVTLWNGVSYTASLTPSGGLTAYKFFIVKGGTTSSEYATSIIVPYDSIHSTNAFRGIGGYELSSGGLEIHSVTGSVSSGKITISDCRLRKTGTLTSTSGTRLYIRRVIGIQ